MKRACPDRRIEKAVGRPRRPLRCGASLVEMLVVMTVAAAMVGLAISTIHLLLGTEREATRSVRYAASVARLAHVFRDDIHAAEKVELPAAAPDGPLLLVVTSHDGRIFRYELDAHVATRTEADAPLPPLRDQFYFPPHSRLRFERENEKGLVRLVIEMAGKTTIAGPDPSASEMPVLQTLAIEAAPARFHRVKSKASSKPPSDATNDKNAG